MVHLLVESRRSIVAGWRTRDAVSKALVVVHVEKDSKH